jgi:integrase
MARTKATERARDRTLTNDEIRKLWGAAEGSRTPYARMLQFILLTGARRAEAAELPWSEIDGTGWMLVDTRNKTKVDHFRPLTEQARSLLPAPVDGCPFVFTTDGMNPISGFSKFKALFDEETGLSDWTVHDLRRTARTLMSRAGVPTDIAERCLGHVIGGVRAVYDRHEYFTEKQKAYEALAALIERIVAPADNVTPLKRRGV